MDEEQLSVIVDKSLSLPDLSYIKTMGRKASGRQVVMGLLSCVPFAGGLISGGAEALLTFKDYDCFRRKNQYQ